MDDIIIITAAGAGTWIREKLSPVRWMGEALIPDYKEKMDLLRDVDDRIYYWTKDLKDLLKQAKNAVESRRLVDLVLVLNAINHRLKSSVELGEQVQKVTDEALTEFEKQSNLKTAGVWSDLKREWVAKKLQTEERKQRQIALNNLILFTTNAVNRADNILNYLHKNRAAGEIGKYIDGIKLLSKVQAEFQRNYSAVYDKHLHPLMKDLEKEIKQQEAYEKQQEAAALIPELKTEPVVSKKPEQSEQLPQVINTKIPSVKELGEQLVPSEIENIPDLPPAEPMEELTKYRIDTSPEDEVKKQSSVSNSLLKLNNQKFLLELLKTAESNDPYLLAAMLASYSEKIEKYNFDQSVKLLALAKEIVGE